MLERKGGGEGLDGREETWMGGRRLSSRMTETQDGTLSWWFFFSWLSCIFLGLHNIWLFMEIVDTVVLLIQFLLLEESIILILQGRWLWMGRIVKRGLPANWPCDVGCIDWSYINDRLKGQGKAHPDDRLVTTTNSWLLRGKANMILTKVTNILTLCAFYTVVYAPYTVRYICCMYTSS